VARRWVSCGDAASRSNGGAYDMVCWARVGLILPPGLASVNSLVSRREEIRVANLFHPWL
jgi:hypothetical protein